LVLTLLSFAPASWCAPNNDADALARRAFRYYVQRRYDSAIADFTRSLELDPDQPQTLKLLGLSLQLQNHNEEAQQVFLRAVSLRPRDPEAWFFLARIYYIRNFFDNALSALETALRYRPTDHAALEYRALALEATGETELALKSYENAVTWNEATPNPSASPHLSYGILLYKLGRFAESAIQFERAKHIEPGNWQPYYELGKLYFRQEKLTAAEQQLQSALKTKTANSEETKRVRYLLGRVYYAMGRTEDANRMFAAIDESLP